MTGTLTGPPLEEAPDTKLPIEGRDGLTPVAVTGEYATVPVLVEGPLARTILSVAIPAVGSTFLLIFFVTADAFWVGRQIGPAGLAAVSTSIFWVWAIVSLSEMVSVGITAVAARRHGERRRDLAARAVGDAIMYTTVLSLLVTLFGQIFLSQMFGIEHTTPEVTELGKRYLGTYLWGASLVFCFFTVDASFRASGDTRTPLALLAVSTAAALALDPVLIIGLGPAPKLGIAGAAVSILVTRTVTTIAGIGILAKRGLVKFGVPSMHNIASITRVGLPTALTGIIFSLVYVLLTRTTSLFGVPAMAALGVGHRVESWTFTVGIGFGAAAAAVVGQNLGARRVDRARRAGWIATGFVTAVCFVGASLEFFCAAPFARFFTSDPAVIAEGVRYLRIGALSTLFAGAEVVLEGALGGAGDTLPPMITSTSLTVLRIPLAAWAAAKWGPPGIWWVLSITAVGRGVAMSSLWKWRNWAARAV